jgi:hypothetical protein
MRVTLFALLLTLAIAGSVSAQSLTTFMAQAPAGLVLERGNVDGDGADEVLAYDPASGRGYVLFFPRDVFGSPGLCMDAITLLPGMTLTLGLFDPWDGKVDVFMVPSAGGFPSLATLDVRAMRCATVSEP